MKDFESGLDQRIHKIVNASGEKKELIGEFITDMYASGYLEKKIPRLPGNEDLINDIYVLLIESLQNLTADDFDGDGASYIEGLISAKKAENKLLKNRDNKNLAGDFNDAVKHQPDMYGRKEKEITVSSARLSHKLDYRKTKEREYRDSYLGSFGITSEEDRERLVSVLSNLS